MTSAGETILPALLDILILSMSRTIPCIAISLNGFLSKQIVLVISCEFHQPLIWSLPSMLMSAGQYFSNFSLSVGYPMLPHELTPESNHTSRTSGTLFISPFLHFPHFHFTSS